jgi:hypothetical protein
MAAPLFKRTDSTDSQTGISSIQGNPWASTSFSAHKAKRISCMALAVLGVLVGLTAIGFGAAGVAIGAIPAGAGLIGGGAALVGIAGKMFHSNYKTYHPPFELIE